MNMNKYNQIQKIDYENMVNEDGNNTAIGSKNMKTPNPEDNTKTNVHIIERSDEAFLVVGVADELKSKEGSNKK